MLCFPQRSGDDTSLDPNLSLSPVCHILLHILFSCKFDLFSPLAGAYTADMFKTPVDSLLEIDYRCLHLCMEDGSLLLLVAAGTFIILWSINGSKLYSPEQFLIHLITILVCSVLYVFELHIYPCFFSCCRVFYGLVIGPVLALYIWIVLPFIRFYLVQN